MDEKRSKAKEQEAGVPVGNAATPATSGGTQRPRSELFDELRTLDARAHDGDEEAPRQIRRALEETPNAAQILGNIAVKGAERAYVKKLSGNDALLGEALSMQLEAMRQEIAGPDAYPLERLLAERVVVGWLQLQHAEAACAANLGKPSTPQTEYHQRRLDRVHRRYLAAIRTLAQVRKLLTPTLTQINVAEQQVNVAAGRQEGSP